MKTASTQAKAQAHCILLLVLVLAVSASTRVKICPFCVIALVLALVLASATENQAKQRHSGKIVLQSSTTELTCWDLHWKPAGIHHIRDPTSEAWSQQKHLLGLHLIPWWLVQLQLHFWQKQKVDNETSTTHFELMMHFKPFFFDTATTFDHNQETDLCNKRVQWKCLFIVLAQADKSLCLTFFLTLAGSGDDYRGINGLKTP